MRARHSASLGQHKKAIRDYKRAMLYYTIFRNGGGVDWCFNRLGWEYESLGKHQKAILFYKLERAGRSKKKRRPCDGSTFHNMGFTYAKLGKNDKALACYEQSLSILREVKNRPLEATTLDSMMGFWKTHGKPNLAVFYGKQAVNIYQEIRGNIQGLDRGIQKGYLASHESTYRQLADLLISEGRLPEAEQVLNMLKEEEFFDYLRRDGNEASTFLTRAELTPTETEWDKRYREIADRVTALGVERGALAAKKSRTPAEKQRLVALGKDLEVANHAFRKDSTN